MLRSVVCLLLFLSHARAQDECDEILISDLGSTDTAGTDGAIAQRFGGGQATVPDVLVMSSRTVCLAAAATRGNYRFASVITTYSCSGAAAGACPPGPYPRTDQFEFGCVGSVWQDSTFLVDDLNDPVNPSITTMRRDCSFCVSPDDAANLGIMNSVDTETHCAACDPDCLGGDAGLGLCTGLTSALCCNFYENDMCTDQCSGNLEPDPDANFECVEMCDPLTSPENGQVTLTSRTVGSVANYSCEVGYNLVGSMMRTCQADTGVDWSDNEPTCQIADCGSLPDPANGDVMVTGTTFGSTATYLCIGSDYLLVGDTMRTCQADGTWNSTAPTCAEVCELLTNPVNGQVTLIERFVGEVANYSCDAGFALIGSETRTCQSGSGWSGDEPSCERVQVGFDPILYNVSESDGVAVIVVRRFTPSSIPVTVLFSTQDGTAIAPGDYDAQTLTAVTIQPNEDSSTVPVMIALDGATEGLESLFGRLQAQSGEPVDIIQENATIEILDDDDTDISIERTTYVTIEGIFPSVAICVAVTSGSLERDAIVSFFTVSDSATSTAPADYDATALELTFGPGNTRQCVPVTIVNDDILEGAENFRASLTTSDSAVILDTDTTQVSIIEDPNDGVTVGFEQTVYTTTERTDPTQGLCVDVTSGTLERDVTVLFSTSDGTATVTAPIDYDMISMELTFGPGNNQRCVIVTVNDDDIVEATENFSAILTTLDPAVTLDPDTAQVEILADPDDGIVIGFEMMSYTVTEGTDPSVELCAVVVSGTLERDAIVVFSTGNATAFAPADYDATNVDLTFGPADTRQCATVIIIDNNFGELTENFFATLTTSDSAVTLGTDMARVDILVDPNDVVDCGSLPDPANGMVAMTASTFDSTANYSCIGGYELVGNSQRICQADGQWSGSEPTCNCPIVCQNGGVINFPCTECNCTAGFEGSVCETDIDECSVDDPCQNGATCVNNDGSFTCNCTAGYEGNLCESDIDECTLNDPCRNGATCVNNDGSFTCNCAAGFEGDLCDTDIDECTVNDPCQNGATCVNNDGSFTCNCTAGFEGDLCTTDIDECTVNDPCQNGATCVNNDGSFTCNCTAGFEGDLCNTDIDECTVNDPCQNGATCVNNDGSFTCNCSAGFEGNLCETDIDECTVNEPCQNGATCVNNDGSFTCNCAAGFEGDLCNTDIDECTVNDPCQNGATCVNNDGSFTCNCSVGFEGNLCETDIDECTVNEPCQNGATCVNNDGSFTCNCAAGFEGDLCNTDIDECTLNDPCQNGATCVNNDGSFTCNCSAEFEGNLCETDIDECTVNEPCQNGATCVNNDGSFICNCSAGFEGNLCETDIDECTVNDPCQNGATCVNNDGSFTCNCSAGFEGNVCETDIDECTVNDPCQNGATCVNNDGSFTCNCTAGYEGNLCNLDIDECTVNDLCQNGATCVSNDGSFTCNCTAGFEGNLCETDIDECTANDPCQNGATCVNNDGSFMCNCTAGFEGNLCETDVDECTVSDPCQNGATCINSGGSFACNCTVGYEGDLCNMDIDECATNNPCENGTCDNTDGSFQCTCDAGFTGELCSENIDDCDPNPCQNGGSCTDGVNTFTCMCAQNWNGTTCEVCEIDNCRECAGAPGACIDCEEGYMLDQDICVCGLENCQTCEEVPAKCTECNVDYVLENFMCVSDCGNLSSPLNGEVNLTATLFGSTASYSCIGGYSLVGNTQRVCQADGQWSGSEPTCSCLLSCQNGGTRDALCTECSCVPDYSGDICQDCTIENCVGCTGIPAICTACETGYAVNNGLCNCTLDNCRTCEGTPPVCRQCADGYTINSVDTTLCDCSVENCLDCAGSPPSCVQCQIGFTLVGGGCVPIGQCGVDFCLVCSDDLSSCEECEDGYRLNDPTNCIVIGDEGDNGLDDAAIIGITVGCILAAILLLTIITCTIAGVYRYHHPSTVYRKRRRRKQQRPTSTSLPKFLDRGGEIVQNPFFVGSPHAENIYEMEFLAEEGEEEWQVEKEEGEEEKKDERGEGEGEMKDESREGEEEKEGEGEKEKEGEEETSDLDEEFPAKIDEEAGQLIHSLN